MSGKRNGNLVLSSSTEKAKSRTETGRELYTAYVRVKAASVLSIEDLASQNPDAGIGSDAPLKITIGSLVQLEHGSRPVRLAINPDEFAEAIEEAVARGTLFVKFPWVDPDGKTEV